jgi:hypothetical protein
MQMMSPGGKKKVKANGKAMDAAVKSYVSDFE